MKNKLIESLRFKLQSEVLKSELAIQSVINSDKSSIDDYDIVEYNLKILSDAKIQLKLLESMVIEPSTKAEPKPKIIKNNKTEGAAPGPQKHSKIQSQKPPMVDPAAKERLLKINQAIQNEEKAMSLRDMMDPEEIEKSLTNKPTQRRKKR